MADEAHYDGPASGERSRLRGTHWLLLGVPALLLLLVLGSARGPSAAAPRAGAVEPNELAIEVEVIESPADPEPAPEPQQEPEPEEQLEAAPVAEAPEAETKSDERWTGPFPPLEANYREHVGFAEYARQMERLGGGFFLVDTATNAILRIDFGNHGLRPCRIAQLREMDYSPRTRVITDEPAVRSHIAMARQRHGMTEPEVVLLVPRVLEERIAAGLGQAATTARVRVADVVGFRGEYQLRHGRLVLVAIGATLADGRHERIDARVAL